MSQHSRRQNRMMPRQGIPPLVHNAAVARRRRLQRATGNLAHVVRYVIRGFNGLTPAAEYAGDAIKEFASALTAVRAGAVHHVHFRHHGRG